MSYGISAEPITQHLPIRAGCSFYMLLSRKEAFGTLLSGRMAKNSGKEKWLL